MMGLASEIPRVARGLRRAWRFSVSVVLTLGVGLGLGVLLLSLADPFYLRPPSGLRDQVVPCRAWPPGALQRG